MWTYRPEGRDLETAPGKKVEKRVRHYNHTTVTLIPPCFAMGVDREPGFPVELCGATELHAAFREESRTSSLPAGPALQEIREAKSLFVGFLPGKNTPRDLYRPQ
jgi:hypothetical protein